MPDDDLQQLIDAGMYDQRLRQIQQRFAMGQGFMATPQAQGREVGSTYVAASPFEHVANMIRQLVGAHMVGGALQGEKDLTGQVSAGRKAFMQRLQTAGGVPGPGVPESLARPADPQEMQRLAMMGAGSGDAAMMHAGQTALQGQHFQLQQAQLENTMRHQQELESQGRGRLGLGQDKLEQAERALALKGVRYNSNTGEYENVSGLAKRSVLPRSTGNAAPAAPPATPPSGGGGPPPGGMPPGAQPLGRWQDKALKDLGSDFNPSSGRSGEFGKNQARLNAAQRLLTLAVDPATGGPANLNPAQMSEVSSSLATLIGGGGSSEASRAEMTPYTKGRSMAQLLQWWTDEPHGAGQQAFVKQMIDTANREKGVAQQGIDQVRGQLVAKHQRILRSNPEEVRKVLQGFGWDLGPDGMPTQAKPTTAAATDATAALRKKYGL